jgi:hypothetical protein
MVDVKATLTFGSYHEVDSSEMAFKIAGSMAFKDAAKKADAVLLEPIMKVEVVAPESIWARSPVTSISQTVASRAWLPARHASHHRACAAFGDVRAIQRICVR